MSQFTQRLTYCPKCKDTFSYQYQTSASIDDNLIIKVRCPFCKRKLQVDLNPHKRQTVAVYRADSQSENSAQNNTVDKETLALDLPAQLIARLDPEQANSDSDTGKE